MIWRSAGSWGLTGSRLFSEFNKALAMSFLSFLGYDAWSAHLIIASRANTCPQESVSQF